MAETKKQAETMNDLMKDIQEVTQKQKSASRVDEIRVMKTMLNDPDFKVSIYDRNKGYVGQRCPREEAVKFLGNVITQTTGLEAANASDLATKYEFTKKDSAFFVETFRDFTQTYLSTGRKLPIVQSSNSEAAIFFRPVAAKEKNIPNADGTGNTTTMIPPFNKVICKSKYPKYIGN